jgi:hypothetical protein
MEIRKLNKRRVGIVVGFVMAVIPATTVGSLFWMITFGPPIVQAAAWTIILAFVIGEIVHRDWTDPRPWKGLAFVRWLVLCDRRWERRRRSSGAKPPAPNPDVRAGAK